LPTPHEPLAQDDKAPGRGEEDHEQRQKEHVTHGIPSSEMVRRMDANRGRVKLVSRLEELKSELRQELHHRGGWQRTLADKGRDLFEDADTIVVSAVGDKPDPRTLKRKP